MIETLEPSERARLRQFLVDRFDLNGLKDLAFDLGVDFQSFSHQTKRDFVRELISYFERRGALVCLVMEVINRRPDANEMAVLLTRLPTGSPRQIIVIIVRSEVLLQNVSEFRKEIALKLQVPTDEVVVVGAACGSMRL